MDPTKPIHYLTDHSFTKYDLFEFFDPASLKLPRYKYKGTPRQREDYQALAAHVFQSGFNLVIKDAIENNYSFKVPYTDAFIEITKISGDDFLNARSNGGFYDVDFLQSNFSAAALMYRYKTATKWRKRRIYVDKVRRGQITQNLYNQKY